MFLILPAEKEFIEKNRDTEQLKLTVCSTLGIPCKLLHEISFIGNNTAAMVWFDTNVDNMVVYEQRLKFVDKISNYFSNILKNKRK